MENSYIVASSKAWHSAEFDAIKSQEDGSWTYVASPDALLRSVNEVLGLRYIFFLHWSWHVPAEIWSRHECVCFHMTDVPYGRGGSPLQNLIVRGQKNTKLSALRMVNEIDAGPVYAKRDLSLHGRAEEIYLRAGRLSFEIIRWIIENEPLPEPQQGEIVHFKRRKPEQSELPTTGLLETLYDHIRMLDAPSYPQAFIERGGFRIEFSGAQLEGDELVAQVVIRKKPTDEETES
ncbi:MAG: methionyl-tRNA formyltransferase [Pseudomonas sp. PGPPP3]|nr:MAG: methionyl-tRNA formyltransferase [Pseudomonas sp. PGPPP3]